MELCDLPPHIVELMMVQLKLLRAAKPSAYNREHYIDGANYLDFAREAAERNTTPASSDDSYMDQPLNNPRDDL